MSVHVAGILGLVAIFAIGTARSINLGVPGIVMTFVVGGLCVGESPALMVSGFPVDLFVLLTGVTYLFGVATTNGTVEHIVDGAVHLVRDRRRLIPWMIFAVAAAPGDGGRHRAPGRAITRPRHVRRNAVCRQPHMQRRAGLRHRRHLRPAARVNSLPDAS